MGTSKSFEEFGNKMHLAATNVIAARKASFRTAERRMRPRFRDAARQAAGPNRILSRHRSKAPLDAEFKVKDSATSSFLFINGTGPWGIRDNTDVGGRTGGHTIRPRKSRVLKFVGGDGEMIYVRRVNHPGSVRSAFWKDGRDAAFQFMQKRIPQDTINAINAALSGASYRRT